MLTDVGSDGPAAACGQNHIQWPHKFAGETVISQAISCGQWWLWFRPHSATGPSDPTLKNKQKKPASLKLRTEPTQSVT